jgi:hypothetical protein
VRRVYKMAKLLGKNAAGVMLYAKNFFK